MVLPTHLVHWSLPSCRGGSQHLRTAALRTASHRATSAICTEAASPSNPSVRQRCSTQGAASTSGSGNALTRNQPQPEWRRASTAFGSATARQCTAAAAASSAGSTVGTAVESRNVVEVLRERGLISETTSDELEKAAAEEKLSVYCGFDPTADSLHLGNLLGIIVLSWFQRCGHRPVALLGGATGRVGDPSGKSAERPVLSEQQLEANIAGISAVLEGILDSNKPAGCPEVKFVNNLDWLGGIPFLQFLREVGKYARLGTMLAKDSVRSRLESETGMSFTEFTYQLLQGYDFVHLCREEGVRVQIGGNDQWGNITAGTDLIRRMASPEQPAPDCYGLTFPLLTDAEGRKFGKSEGGAIWLASSKLSPYEFYQHLYRTRDADVVTFLRMLTFLPLPEVDAVAAAMQTPDYEPNTAQKLLAAEVTRFVHGEAGLQEAIKTTQALKPGASTVLDAASLEAIAGNAPSCSLPREEVAGRLVSEVLVAAGLQSSKGAARRLIKGGGVYVNNSKVGDEFATLADTDLIEERLVLLASGKKNKMLLRIE